MLIIFKVVSQVLCRVWQILKLSICNFNGKAKSAKKQLIKLHNITFLVFFGFSEFSVHHFLIGFFIRSKLIRSIEIKKQKFHLLFLYVCFCECHHNDIFCEPKIFQVLTVVKNQHTVSKIWYRQKCWDSVHLSRLFETINSLVEISWQICQKYWLIPTLNC